MVIWITGLSGAGKTTLCAALHDLVKPRLPQFVRIDGDEVRALFGGDLGHSEPERIVQIQRLQALAKLLAEQELVVTVAALYASPELSTWNRANLPGYFEVYLMAPLDLVQARDPKSIYAKAARGEMPNVVGIDIAWHAPENPDLIVDATAGETPAAQALRIIEAVPFPGGLMAAVAE